MPSNESDFNQQFLELQAKISAVIEMLVVEFPAAAVRAREVINGAVAQAAVNAEVEADQARANAIGQLITAAGQMLATAEPA